MPKLKRSLNLFDVVSLAIGAIIGAGVFVLTGLASQVAGPALLVSILLGCIAASLTAISISKLVLAFPKEGGEYEYGCKTLSKFAGFISGWMWTLNKLVAAGVISLGFATYFALLIPSSSLKLTALIIIGLVTIINYCGIRKAGTLIDILVISKLAILFLFIILGLPYVKPSNFLPFAPNGIKGILEAAGIFFFAYVGFARPVYLVEEIKNPKKNVPRGIFFGLLISTIIYATVSFVAIGLVGTNVLGSSNSPLEKAISITGFSWAPILITIGALIATFSVLLDDNLGLSRMIFSMGRKGDYPKYFGQVNKNNVPGKAIILTGIIGVLVILFFDLRSLAETASFFILLYFSLVNLSSIKLKKKTRTAAIVSASGMVITLILAFSLSVKSIIIGTALIIIGAAYFALISSRNPEKSRN